MARHQKCAHPQCRRLLLPGQAVVWVPPTTHTGFGGHRQIDDRFVFGYMHEHHLAGPVPTHWVVVYAEDMNTANHEAAKLREWESRGRPYLGENTHMRA